MKGKCKICGCTEENACYHPDFGACWWVNDEQDLCSHCAELKDVPGVERPSDRGEVELDNLSDKGKIMAGHPFECTFLGVTHKLFVLGNQIINKEILDDGLIWTNLIYIRSISRTGIHWYSFILGCEAKGFIRFKDCKVIN